jgi:hypothetical protein
MVLTKADLNDWKSNPVTKEIQRRIAEARQMVAESSPIRDTADQTAMQSSYNNGWIEGADAVSDAFFEALEEAD